MSSNSIIMQVPVATLAKHVDPMRLDTWQCGVIAVVDVECCEDPSIGRMPVGSTTEDSSSWEYNVARIAWLSERGWKSHESDIEPVALYVADDGCLQLVDGNHRLAAAIVRGDAEITVTVSGNLETARNLFALDFHVFPH